VMLDLRLSSCDGRCVMNCGPRNAWGRGFPFDGRDGPRWGRELARRNFFWHLMSLIGGFFFCCFSLLVQPFVRRVLFLFRSLFFFLYFPDQIYLLCVI